MQNQTIEQKTQFVTIVIAGIFSLMFTFTCCFDIIYSLLYHTDRDPAIAFSHALTIIAYWMPSPARLMQPIRTATTTTLAVDADDDTTIAQVSQKP